MSTDASLPNVADSAPATPQILGPDRLAEWREFAASFHRAFTRLDCEMDPMELVGHIDAMQVLLDREVKVSLAGMALREAVHTILGLSGAAAVDYREAFAQATAAYDAATGWEPEEAGS